jgi:hypothetical protein
MLIVAAAATFLVASTVRGRAVAADKRNTAEQAD